MEVKIHCPCETRFAFDVEPLNGRMPVRVNCPGCGADRTELANEMIRQKLAPVAPLTVDASVARVIPPAPIPAGQPMRVAVAQPPAAAVPETAAAATFCFRHLKNPAVETCRVCGKPICEECMEQYGYACSTYCRKRAEETGMDLPVYASQRAVVEARIHRVAAWIWRAAIFLGAVFVGAWIWYAFFASHPRVIYSEKLPHGDRARFYQFLVPNQVLLIKASQMSLFDVAQQRQLWSVPLNVGFSPPPPPDSARPGVEEQVRLYPEPHVVATAKDLWVLFPDRLVQYDRGSGNSRQQIPLNPPFFGLAKNDDAITAISSDESGQQIMTRISLADGAVKTDPIKFASVAPLPSDRPAKPPAQAPAANNQIGQIFAAAKTVLPTGAKSVERESLGDQFVADGASVVQMKVDLIEHKTVTHQAMKTEKKKSLVDDSLTAGQSLEAAEQMINETRREQTGGVEEEDVSRYQVTLRRWPAGSAPDWTGEVIGSPSFFALKTLNVLVARNVILVFDKNNKKLWSANLTYSVASHYLEDFATEADPPCVEDGSTLYVFDQGMLTSFEAATGDVHWRLTSVGISQLQPEGKKSLYVTSTTASPDSIQFSQQVNFASKAGPVVLKVDAVTGKVLWRTEGIGDKCFVSGKFVYISKAAENPLITPGEDPVLYFDLYRLNPSDGHPMWDYSQDRHPLQIEVQGNEILLHFRGELQVLKFLSL
ncbi:MAG: PQQ-binding-like beta-propeller repeat protein [Verrucomicrobiia bacterium]